MRTTKTHRRALSLALVVSVFLAAGIFLTAGESAKATGGTPASVSGASTQASDAEILTTVWVNSLNYGSAGGGFYWDFKSGLVWTAERGWHRYSPQSPSPTSTLWVNYLTYGSAGGGFYLDPQSGLLWTSERGWHAFSPAPAGGNLLTFVPNNPPAATEGQPYLQFSFCEPTPEHFDLGACGPGTTNPRGGSGPYHFQLDSGSGFPPLGMSLGKDGQLTGTPHGGTGGRTYFFRVCTVDLSANQVCGDVWLYVGLQGAPTPTPTPTPIPSSNALTFVPTNPPAATEGQPYPQFSFCEPTPEHFDLGACGPGTTNPRGGSGPYHFQLDSGSGFPPLGMSLGKDGQLTGTPHVGTGGRTYFFRVCAVDLSANQVCADVWLYVGLKQAPTPTPTPTVSAGGTTLVITSRNPSCSGCLSWVFQGTASGPVNTILTDPQWYHVWNCGSWSRGSGLCIRDAGQPETTTFSVTVIGPEPGDVLVLTNFNGDVLASQPQLGP